MTDALSAVRAELQAESGCHGPEGSPYQPNYWNLHRDDQVPTRRSPDDCDGAPDLAIGCTQLDVPAAQQRRLVAQWVQALPTMQHVRRLGFTTRVSQELFDAACQLQGLQDLSIHSSSIRSLQGLPALRGLLRLRLGASASVESLAPLDGMTRLQWLALVGMGKIPDLEPLASLSGLQGLFVAGNESKPLRVPTLAPLASLQALRWLQLGALRVARDGLDPLAALQGLTYLGLPNHFSTEEFARLAARLPHTRGDWLAPYARQHPGSFPCPRCRQRGRVLTAGSPMKCLCPSCDAEALARHVLRFRQARDASRPDPDAGRPAP